MKRILAGCWLLSTLTVMSVAAPRDAQWKEVDEAARQGLPRTAITNLQSILQGALRDGAYPEAVKALARRIALEGALEGGRADERISRLQAERSKMPSQMAPLIDALLAHWYWQYFQENRWRFLQRTASTGPGGDDIRTWDLSRILKEVDQRFQNALATEQELKRTPISDWDALLMKGTMPDALRPTLYDFIAHEALKFYSAGEQAGAKPQADFQISAESPVFGTVQEFLEWRPVATPDMRQTSPALKALELYQTLLRFHQTDPAPKLAFVHNDLERLTWAWNTAVGAAKDPSYEVALRRFIQANENLDLSALAAERLARRLQTRDELVLARQTALRAAHAFPDSPGGILCQALVDQIEAKSFEIETERVWNAPWPNIEVRYRNLQTLHFRAIPYEWELFLERRRNRPENLNQAERREVLSRAAALEWSIDLPPTSDYKQRDFSAASPATLKPGFYFIVASHQADFSEKGNLLHFCDVWVSELAMVLRPRHGIIEGFILEAGSGEPIQNAVISAWYLGQNGTRIAEPNRRTDANGLFSFRPNPNRGYLIRARHGARELASIGDFASYEVRREDPSRLQTFLFSDRAIYRPGQTVQYKGICVSVDTGRDRYEAAKGEDLTVVFMDPNGKVIARQNHRANEYGSFSGSFTAPRDRLMGGMSLSIEGRAPGTAHIRVEEYKRPKFEVTLDAPPSAPKLNERVMLTGRAMTYAGASVDDSELRFRVVRETRMPWWWGRGRGLIWPPRPAETQEIAQGTARTGIDGSFSVEFVAQPDPEIPEKDDPSFSFHVNVEVTDAAGETRTADRHVLVGYSSLQAVVSADEWQTEQKPVELKVSTQTLDGDPQAAKGTVTIHELLAPAQVIRPEPAGPIYPYLRGPRLPQPGGDTNNQAEPENWPLGRALSELPFETGTNGQATLRATLTAGAYRAVIETVDRFGRKVTGRLTLLVLNPDADKLSVKIPHLLTAPQWELQPGDRFVSLWGTGYDSGRAFIEIEHRDRVIRSFWTEPKRTQQQLDLVVTETMRGGFTLRVTRVQENRAYLDTKLVQVPWQNKQLELKWERFVSRLEPGQRETWTLAIKGAGTNAQRALAEMMATLYDESLDAFAPLSWVEGFNVFRQEHADLAATFQNMAKPFTHALGAWDQPQRKSTRVTYRFFPPELLVRDMGSGMYPARGRFSRSLAADNLTMRYGLAAEAAPAPAAATVTLSDSAVRKSESLGVPLQPAGGGAPGQPQPRRAPVDLSQVSARRNLNETAFFFPQLTSDSNGTVRLTFTMPEALTQWRFLGFAHDRDLRSGFLEAHAVTSKDLMVQPNPPRFLREGDTVEFTVKVSNQSDARQIGNVRLTFARLQDESSADRLLGNSSPEQAFDIPARQSRAFSWRISVPDGCGFLSYKAVAGTVQLSDGEEGAVPVLSRRILVTESLPLPIRGPGTKKFEFTRLLKSEDSDSLQHRNFTVQMVSNPAWYAVLALPYLMEYPHECSEQVFNRLYANSLARFIANRDPQIRRIFDQWKNAPALDSPLEKNQDLKAVLIEETPWLRHAQNESQARRNVGILFDANRLNSETDKGLSRLGEMQLEDGSWPWFPGGRGNSYITLYITTGFGRLRHLGAPVDVHLALLALRHLDQWMADNYRDIQQRPEPEKYVLNAHDALYLYGRSFFLNDVRIAPEHEPALRFFLGQARTNWAKIGQRQSQAHVALALQRFAVWLNSSDAIPMVILRSLKERSVSDPEMGMSWRDTGSNWWWYHAPIETHALMIEAFDEVARDSQAVENLRVWLLKQKQTTDWKTTKATADAVYSLLLRGRDLLSDRTLARLKVGGQDITPPAGAGRQLQSASAVEPGTGFYEVRFAAADVKPRFGRIEVTKSTPGVAWGSAHWQYLEDMSKVTPHSGTPLKLAKTLHRKVNTDRGLVLQPVNGPLNPGDELVVRVELRTDRDMEYVHLKDQRGSGTEPVSVLSHYKYQDGLGYYESTRDTASHFFIDYLPRGTYVFEYSTRVQLRGQYQTGVAEIQCMYAPEFNSHSASIPITVR